MTTCIYGAKAFDEGSVICVNGRGLRCVAGEWQEAGLPCREGDAVEGLEPTTPLNQPSPAPGDAAATKAKR